MSTWPHVIDIFDQEIETSDLAICLGSFDGLHIGHMEVINKALSLSKHVALLTIENSYKEKLGKRTDNLLLTTLEDRKNMLAKYGVEYILPLHFDDNIKNMSPYDFIKLLVSRTHPKYIVCGSDFKFGKMAAGNIDTLISYESEFGYKTTYVQLCEMFGQKVSTTNIIKLIKEGDIDKANQLLGYSYTLKGLVVHGYENGKKIGYRTANIKCDNYVIPHVGVYATTILVDGIEYLSMTNIGTHPTISKLQEPLIETHIVGFDGDLYEHVVSLSFLEYMRPETQFESIDKLKEQLKKDEEYIIAKYSSSF